MFNKFLQLFHVRPPKSNKNDLLPLRDCCIEQKEISKMEIDKFWYVRVLSRNNDSIGYIIIQILHRNLLELMISSFREKKGVLLTVFDGMKNSKRNKFIMIFQIANNLSEFFF